MYLTLNNDIAKQLYMLPRINKMLENPPGRPIASESKGLTEKDITVC